MSTAEVGKVNKVSIWRSKPTQVGILPIRANPSTFMALHLSKMVKRTSRNLVGYMGVYFKGPLMIM
jgi:hypothetical protein